MGYLFSFYSTFKMSQNWRLQYLMSLKSDYVLWLFAKKYIEVQIFFQWLNLRVTVHLLSVSEGSLII